MTNKKGSSLYKATEFHEKRSKRSRGVDESKTAKDTKSRPTKAWYDDPSTSDVYGIDSKKAKAKSVKQAIDFLQSIQQTHVSKENIEKVSKKKAIITHPKITVRTLQKAVNVRFNNVKIYKRKKKGKPKDFWVSVLKK